MPIDAGQTLPAQGSTVVAGTAPLAFKIVAPGCDATDMSIEVASKETYDQNDSLADEVQVDYFGLAHAGPRGLPGPDHREVAADARHVLLAGLHGRQLRWGGLHRGGERRARCEP